MVKKIRNFLWKRVWHAILNLSIIITVRRLLPTAVHIILYYSSKYARALHRENQSTLP